MIGVAFDFGRSALVACNENADGIPATRHDRCKMKRYARNHVFSCFCERQDVFLRTPYASAEGNGCRCGALKRHEVTSVEQRTLVDDLFKALRKFSLGFATELRGISFLLF